MNCLTQKSLKDTAPGRFSRKLLLSLLNCTWFDLLCCCFSRLVSSAGRPLSFSFFDSLAHFSARFRPMTKHTRQRQATKELCFGFCSFLHSSCFFLLLIVHHLHIYISSLLGRAYGQTNGFGKAVKSDKEMVCFFFPTLFLFLISFETSSPTLSLITGSLTLALSCSFSSPFLHYF